MGLEITAFLGNAGKSGGGRPALEAMIKRGPAFIQECITMAKQNGYAGYSIDHELHCNEDAGACSAATLVVAAKRSEINIATGGRLLENDGLTCEAMGRVSESVRQ